MLLKHIHTYILSLFVLCPHLLAAQTQGGRVYEFMNLPATAQITALGGYAIPNFDGNLGMSLYYPSLIGIQKRNELSLNYVSYFADISYGTAAYSLGFDKIGEFTAAIQYVDYGRFEEADEFGTRLGDFTAADYVIQLGWGRMLTPRLGIGSNIKFINSVLESYSSYGVATDLSVSYMNDENLWAAALSLRNIGRQIQAYYNQREALPFEITLGVSKKLINAPLRFSFVAHNLQTFDLSYDDPFESQIIRIMDGSEETQTAQERASETADKIMRHLIVGAEFLPTKNLMFAVGYNYRRRQEMKIDTRPSTVGLSWGLGIKVSHFTFKYGRSNYHLAGAPNHFSISTNMDALFFSKSPVSPVVQD